MTSGISISGASTGIGRACALEGANRGGWVSAGVRQPPAGDTLRAEANVLGLLASRQASLPLLGTGRGRIVNTNSSSGRVATPRLSAYAASKFAVEGLSDTRRRALAAWGIPVSRVEILREANAGPLQAAGLTRAESGLVDRLLKGLQGATNALPLRIPGWGSCWPRAQAGRVNALPGLWEEGRLVSARSDGHLVLRGLEHLAPVADAVVAPRSVGGHRRCWRARLVGRLHAGSRAARALTGRRCGRAARRSRAGRLAG